MESTFDVTSTNALIRSPEDDIDEVYPRMYMSGWQAAENVSQIEKLGITHILSATPGAREKLASKGIKYLIFNDIQDN